MATKYNPADLALRGVFPQDLILQELWWKGPPWLTDSPVQWPIRVDIGDLPVGEDRPKTAPVLTVQVIEEPAEIKRFSSSIVLLNSELMPADGCNKYSKESNHL